MGAKTPSLDTIFCTAVEIASADERAIYLEKACSDDHNLRGRVESLVAAHFRAGSFLESPPFPLSRETADAGASGVAVTTNPPIAERPGTIIGPYKLLEQIGEGGFGIVFMAEQHAALCRKVALKVLKPGMDSRLVLARFEAERQALALMDHPNIAHVFDGGATESGRPYFVMELVRGIPITEFCDQGNLSVRERLELFVNVCQAVQHAHQKGIIHRDVKPTNVLVTLHDGTPVVKVIDFGIAKALGQPLTDKTLFTQFAQFIGTPVYMSPEQAALSGLDVDTRSDIYSLGVLLYELLTGKTPFDEKRLREATFDELRRIIREEEPVKPSTRISTLGLAAATVSAKRKSDPKRLSQLFRGELDWIVTKALEKDRNRRYETASALAADVHRYLHDETVLACPPSAGYRLRKFLHRYRRPVMVAWVLFSVLLAGMAGTSWGLVRAERAKVAQRKAKEAAEAKEAETQAVLDFVEKNIIAAARPEGQYGGQGRDVTLRQALEKALPVVEKSFADQPLIEARLRSTLGSSFLYLGEAKIAAEQFQRARAIYTEHFGLRDADTLSSMNRLAICYVELGRLPDACALHQETLDLRQAALGHNHIDTLRSMNNLAVVYASLGRYADALKLHEETLALRQATLGPDHPDTVESMWGVATGYYTLERYREALQLREEIMAAEKALHSLHHPSTIKSMHNLAISYFGVGRYADAIKLFEETLPLHISVFGPTNSDTISCMGNLAHCYAAVGRHGDALKLREEILPLRIARSGLNHYYTFRSMYNLAESYIAVGRYTEGLKLHEETLALRKAKIPDHPDTLLSMWSVANCFAIAGRRAEALKLYEETLALRKARTGPDSFAAIQVMRSIAALRMNINELAVKQAPAAKSTKSPAVPYPDMHEQAVKHAPAPKGTKLPAAPYPDMHEHAVRPMPHLAPKSTKSPAAPHLDMREHRAAEAMLVEALELARAAKRHAETPLESAGILAQLGDCRLRQGQFCQAEADLRACLAVWEEKDSDNWLTSWVQSLLGAALLGQQNYAEAEPLLLAGYEGMSKRAGLIPARDRRELGYALQRVIRLYDAWGKKDQADAWRQKRLQVIAAAWKGF